MTDAEIQQYLEENGYPPHVVRAGRAGLIRRWAEFVNEVEGGYAFGIEDYRNDLDIRGILATLSLDSEPEVAEADKRLRAILIHPDQRVWESTAGDPFWDFGYPRNAGHELIKDLRHEGLAGD